MVTMMVGGDSSGGNGSDDGGSDGGVANVVGVANRPANLLSSCKTECFLCLHGPGDGQCIKGAKWCDYMCVI